MLRSMRKVDVQDELQEGVEVAPLPPMGPDGGPILSPLRPVTPPRPRLCEAGPCQNYHRFEIQMDAAQPHTMRVPISLPPDTPGAQAAQDGTLYQPPPTFHVQVHHYCYPNVGVEMALGDLPVTDCNRWDPYTHGSPLIRRTEAFLRSFGGERYQDEVRAWEAARQQEQREAQEVEDLIGHWMANNPGEEPR